MKTFRAIIVTFIATVVTVAGIILGFAINEGIVTVETESVKHTKVVVVDGNVEEQHEWSDLNKIVFKVNANAQAAIDM